MSMFQTTASGHQLTLLCGTDGELISRRCADTWLRQRQAARFPTSNEHHRHTD